jgi:hypothetical protein
MAQGEVVLGDDYVAPQAFGAFRRSQVAWD